MELLNPSALSWLLLALPIVVFYILKIRLRRVPVSTTLFWEQIFEQKQPRSLWEHLRHLLSLLLQLALLALLVFALAEPFFTWQGREARRIVLIVDNSASMNADDVAPSRLVEARRRGKQLVDGLRYNDEMAVIAAGTGPRVASGMTGHQRTLREAIDAIPATDGPTRVAEAVALARRLLADSGKNQRIILLTDAAFDEARELADADDVDLIAIGGPSGNVGITRFQVRRSLRRPTEYEILAEVRNLADEPASVRLDIDLNDDPIDAVPLELKPGETWSRTFEKTSLEGGHVQARLADHRDPLPADDSAWAILPRREALPVTLNTEGNLFLEKVFEAIPLVRLTVAEPGSGKSPNSGVTVFHRQVPETLPPGPLLVIEPTGSTDLWELGEAIQDPIVVKQDSDSELMAHVKLENVSMPEARALKFKTKATTLAESIGGEPLYALIDRPAGKVLVLTVNLDKGDLPLQTAFPILMANATAVFSGPKGELRESQAAGSVAEVPLPAGSSSADRFAIRPPGADPETIPLPEGLATAPVGPLDRCGVWQVVRLTGDSETPPNDAPMVAEVACNLASPRESDLRPVKGLTSDRASLGGGFGGRPIWFYLVAAGFFLAATEWYLYQRRWIS